MVIKFIQHNIFYTFRCLRATSSDRGTHFTYSLFRSLLRDYEVNHKIATNAILKLMVKLKIQIRKLQKLQKVIWSYRKDWPLRLNDALLACRFAYKTSIGMSSYQLVYEKYVIYL